MNSAMNIDLEKDLDAASPRWLRNHAANLRTDRLMVQLDTLRRLVEETTAWLREGLEAERQNWGLGNAEGRRREINVVPKPSWLAALRAFTPLEDIKIEIQPSSRSHVGLIIYVVSPKNPDLLRAIVDQWPKIADRLPHTEFRFKPGEGERKWAELTLFGGEG